MPDTDPRLALFGEVLRTLLRKRKLTRAEIERRMVRGKGYLYRCFTGFQGLSVGTLLHALDEAGIPFEEFVAQLFRETHPDLLLGGLAAVSPAEVKKVVNQALAENKQQEERERKTEALKEKRRLAQEARDATKATSKKAAKGRRSSEQRSKSGGVGSA